MGKTSKRLRKNAKQNTELFNPMNPPYKKRFDWTGAHYTYTAHYNSNPYITEHREPNYTFFADMAILANFYGGEQLKKKLVAYEKRVIHLCKKNKEALCIMIDSLNLLGWVLYESNGRQRDEAIDWLFAEYERLFYRDWTNYVSEEEMRDIWHELN